MFQKSQKIKFPRLDYYFGMVQYNGVDMDGKRQELYVIFKERAAEFRICKKASRAGYLPDVRCEEGEGAEIEKEKKKRA